MSGVQRLTVAADEAELRLDRWFKRHFPALTHGRLEKLLRTGQVRVDGGRVQASLRLAAGQEIRVPPLADAPPPSQPHQRPVSDGDLRDLQAAVLYRDDDVLAIDKPVGLAVQGGTGVDRHLDAMLDGLRFGSPERPRLVHRLDRDTSGVLILARHARAAAELTAAFRRKECRKIYWAVVVGMPPERRGRIVAAIEKRPGPAGDRMRISDDGQAAVTEYRVIDTAGRRAAWLELRPVTGRTHQLRVHCVALGTPVLGDGKYGGRLAFLDGPELDRRLHLHAHSIEVPRPAGAKLRISAPLPAHLAAAFRFFGFSGIDVD